MNFNPDSTSQTQEVIFSRKPQNTNHRCLIFIHHTVKFTESQKHVGVGLDSRLDLKDNLEIIFKNVSRAIGFLRKLQNLLPIKSLMTVYKYKSFIRPHTGYGDIIYVQIFNSSFHRKLESIQYHAARAITGAVLTSEEKLSRVRFWTFATETLLWNSFFSANIKEWNMLDSDIRSS